MSLPKYSANLPLIQTLPSRVAFDWVATPEHRAPFLIEIHGRLEKNHFSEILKARSGRF